MRTIKTSITSLLMVSAMLFMSEMVKAQGVKRQVVASIVSSGSQSGTVPLTVGQPYSTVTFYDANSSFTPGFQQPLKTGKDERKIENQSFAARLYPNPANNVFSIDARTSKNIIEVKVNNILGRTIYEWNGSSLDNQQINSGSWPSGMYVIMLKDEAGASSVSKINIQH